MIRIILVILFSAMLSGCGPSDPVVTRIDVRPFSPTITVEPGKHELGLGGLLLVNRSVSWRDGALYIPRNSSSRTPLPLLVWLHGGGGRAEAYDYMFPLAEELGVVILTLDARHNTWDGIDSLFGPDVLFIEAALRHTFERVAIDPTKIALGGLSDGGAYALALGRSNGDLFTHLVAVAPGWLEPPAPTIGLPRIFVGHGTRDNVYSVAGSRRFIVPSLRKADYDVTYLEFDGPHWVPAPIARKILEWLKK